MGQEPARTPAQNPTRPETAEDDTMLAVREMLQAESPGVADPGPDAAAARPPERRAAQAEPQGASPSGPALSEPAPSQPERPEPIAPTPREVAQDTAGFDALSDAPDDTLDDGRTAPGLVDRLRAKLPQAARDMIRQLRWKHAVWAALALIMVLRPWLIPGLLFVSLWIVLIAYFTVGPDRVAELLATGFERFSARSPDRAAALLRRAQRGADRVDGWLARLPERWTDGIYLPDLGRSQLDGGATRLDDAPDPFDRLAQEEEARGHRI